MKNFELNLIFFRIADKCGRDLKASKKRLWGVIASGYELSAEQGCHPCGTGMVNLAPEMGGTSLFLFSFTTAPSPFLKGLRIFLKTSLYLLEHSKEPRTTQPVSLRYGLVL
ncbi:hypothetical protein [Eubacterium sp.]|nr:hypothetical protein [Eubacterium sp.]MDO5434406.1 hypothetical protein [Eubacterium sp.]